MADDSGISWPRGLAFGSNNTYLSIADMPAHTHTITGGTTGSTGGSGNTANNYQPSLVVRWLISFFGIFPSSTGTFGQDNSVTQADSPDQTSTGNPYIGEIRLIGGGTATGLSATAWKLLDGQLYPIADNDTLFQLIGTTYGGDGNASFGVPDLRGRLSVAVDSSNLPLGSIVGLPTLQISLSQLASHAHLVDLGITDIQHFSDGSSTIFLKGMVGSLAKVELSDDGVTWSTLGTAVQLTNGTGSITDPNTAGSTRRFYRAR